MSSLRISIGVVWVVFWVCWMLSASGAKQGTRARWSRPPGLVIAVPTIVLLRVFHAGSLAVNSPILEAVGVVLFLSGLGLAIWARIHLGRNWGMPMTRKDEPELVTSGPYRLVRHPIYSGILLGVLGTAGATDGYWLIAFVLLGVYFIYSAKVEEGLMTETFPAAYPSYRMSTKMLIPFVL